MYTPFFICVQLQRHCSLLTGNRVLVSFSLFELETSEFCNEDYVELRRESAVGPVIGVYCGTDIPSNITAAHSIWVRFQSSGTGTARGFIADYSMCELHHCAS
jgi:cubilin